MFLAYKYVIISIIALEAGFYANRLQLPIQHSATFSNLSYQLPTPPLVLFAMGAGGRIDTEKNSIMFAKTYSFSFGRGHRFITKLHPFEGANMAEENNILARGRSLVDTNGAYLLASNWLVSIQVDVTELEKTNQAEVRQRWYYGPNGKTKLPVFEVKWGTWDDPKVKVSIDGRTKDMVYIRQEDDSFSRRPEELVKNLDKLLEIPDEEFQKYSSMERSNLISQYSAVDYSHPAEVPLNITHRYDITNNYNLIFQRYTIKTNVLEKTSN